ncbi:glycosyltransferase [Rhodospirillaceae bacterium SYSU D60014]|uniref:glycosyltransferase n=1 Tax=Virgifigura deserti TaxID=2268457 RepID=UPI000E668C34
MSATEDPVRIFVGTDRSQLLAVKVLDYSVRRHTDLPVELIPMLDLPLPEPRDLRQRQRTGFSFARFAIPRLAGYRGRALYLDADMLVLQDIAELWTLPFDGAKVIIQEAIPEEHRGKRRLGRTRRAKQCSVMLLDCERLDWQPEAIIAGLDGAYGYEDLVHRLCILDETEIRYAVPFRWNSLEVYRPETCLIHYTDMETQPWVSTDNRNGWLWLNEVKQMLEAGALSWAEIEEEVRFGHFRPSLLAELRLPADHSIADRTRKAMLDRIDADAGFIKHRAAYAAMREREAAARSSLSTRLLPLRRTFGRAARRYGLR